MEQSDLSLHCLLFHPHLLDAFWQCKTIPLHFYNNNGYHDSVPIFRIFKVNLYFYGKSFFKIVLEENAIYSCRNYTRLIYIFWVILERYTHTFKSNKYVRSSSQKEDKFIDILREIIPFVCQCLAY